MITFSVILISPFLIYWIFEIKKINNHDDVLYEFCQQRREAMSLLRAEYQNTINLNFEKESSLCKEDLEALSLFLKLLNDVIHDYDEFKVVFSNFRKIEALATELKKSNENVKSIATNDKRVKEIKADIRLSLFFAFYTYTPFLKYEVTIKFLYVVLQIASEILKYEIAQKALSFLDWLDKEKKEIRILVKHSQSH